MKALNVALITSIFFFFIPLLVFHNEMNEMNRKSLFVLDFNEGRRDNPFHVRSIVVVYQGSYWNVFKKEQWTIFQSRHSQNMSRVARKPVFEFLRRGKTRTSVLSLTGCSGPWLCAYMYIDFSNRTVQPANKALIRLCGCAGWSAPLLFACDKRQVFSLSGSIIPNQHATQRHNKY